MSTIAKASQGFVYLVSVTGVTGMKEQVSTRVEGLVNLLHDVTDKPVSVQGSGTRPLLEYWRCVGCFADAEFPHMYYHRSASGLV
jgi:hypothetical protein